MKKQKETYAVLGLGKYGRAVAKELVDKGMEVLAVDINPKIVDEAVDYLPICKCADVTDKAALKALGIAGLDTVIVCIACNLEASVMAVTICKGLGVKRVIAKCGSELHQEILRRVGADTVYFPENESGIRLARRLIASGFVEIDFKSNKVSIAEVPVKDEWVGKKLSELRIREKEGFKVIAIKNGEDINFNSISPRLVLKKGSTLLVIGYTAKLGRLK